MQKEYSKLCRELARPIEVLTLRPHPSHFVELVGNLLNRFPNITIEDGVLRSADANRGRYPDEGGKRGVFPFVGWQTRGVADGQASRSSDKTDMTYIQHTTTTKIHDITVK